jgi:hypothetical protein
MKLDEKNLSSGQSPGNDRAHSLEQRSGDALARVSFANCDESFKNLLEGYCNEKHK